MADAQDITRLNVKVTPKASRNAIRGFMGETLKVAVTAAPERGRANEAVVELLADALAVPKSAISVVAGHTQPRKRVEVRGLAPEAVATRLARF